MGPRKLYVKYVYIPYIESIVTENLTFKARVDYDLMWDASEEEIQECAKDPKAYEPDFVPDLVFQNACELDIIRVPLANGNAFKIEDGKNFLRLKVIGTFIQRFDLSMFPFDQQEITIYVTLSFYDADHVRFAALNPDKATTIILTKYTAIKDWSIMSCFSSTYIAPETGQAGYPWLKTSIRVRRIPWSFVLRDMVLACLITLSSLICWGLHPSDTASRLSILGTVLLTLAAFQLVISASLPSMPNPTYADFYSGCSFLFVFGLMVAVATLGRLYNDQSQDPDYPGFLTVFDDTMLFIASGAVFAFYHVIFIIIGIREFRRDKHAEEDRKNLQRIIARRAQNRDPNRIAGKGFLGAVAKFAQSGKVAPDTSDQHLTHEDLFFLEPNCPDLLGVGLRGEVDTPAEA